MNAQSILEELKALGSPGYRKILTRHGVKEPCYGVKIEDLKKIQKRVKKDYRLALELYDSGVYDAMYLAGLIADDARMTKADLQRWVERSEGGALSGTTVPSVAAGGPHGREMANQWIDSEQELIASAGWATWSALVSVKPDGDLDLAEVRHLLRRVEREIHQAPNDVRYQMNSLVIAVGCFVSALTGEALAVAEKIGCVEVDMGPTACQVPFAPDYIRKVEARGTIGKKAQIGEVLTRSGARMVWYAGEGLAGGKS
jgi:3-methyladenine DNA glycosylase AlkD